MLDVLSTDSVLERMLKMHKITKGPYAFPQFCQECRMGRRLLPWKLDIYRESRCLPVMGLSDLKMRKDVCRHDAAKTWVYFCPNYCCFYECCQQCRDMREELGIVDFLGKLGYGVDADMARVASGRAIF